MEKRIIKASDIDGSIIQFDGSNMGKDQELKFMEQKNFEWCRLCSWWIHKDQDRSECEECKNI